MFDTFSLPCMSEYISRPPAITANFDKALPPAKMANWSVRRRRGLWILGISFLALFLFSLVFEVADANDAEASRVELAVRKVLNRRRTIELSMGGSATNLVNQQASDDDRSEDEISEKEEFSVSSDDTSDDAILNESVMNTRASLVCLFGAVFSLHTLLVEHMKWNPKSFQRFSVATKIPVEVFCVSGPLVLVSAIIYIILAGLLFIGGGSSSAFFIAASWSAIMVDMSFVCYSNPFYEILTNRVDVVLHIVNLLAAYSAFMQLRFFPYTFVICGLSFWGVVIGIRCFRRFRADSARPPNGVAFRPGSP